MRIVKGVALQIFAAILVACIGRFFYKDYIFEVGYATGAISVFASLMYHFSQKEK